ncbi:MAG TPA: hypothetical protein VGP64_13480 [Polyangia bacterium]|jgi:hypothetical protein
MSACFVTTDPGKIDRDLVHGFLAESYWSRGIRRWVLATRDAHGLYARYGFTPLQQPDRFMERWNPQVYQR